MPVTYLGVETSEVPSVVAEQLGLAKGFGLVVDYVVPDGPAAQAGLQQNDILEKLNEQILMEPDQLSKLIRSFPEGTSVTLAVRRKGAATTLTARLGKREVPARRQDWGLHGPGGMFDHEQFTQEMKKLGDELGNLKIAGLAPDVAERTREELQHAKERMREAQSEARDRQREARDREREARDREREQAREARERAREMRVSRGQDGSVKQTLIDMRKAHIVYHDEKGELNIQNVDGKKVLTAKDPQGRLVFSGPVGSKEELDKVPADVRQRYEKLEKQDIPAVSPATPPSVENDNDDDNDNQGETMQEVSHPEETRRPEVSRPDRQVFPHRRLGINTVLI